MNTTTIRIARVSVQTDRDEVESILSAEMGEAPMSAMRIFANSAEITITVNNNHALAVMQILNSVGFLK